MTDEAVTIGLDDDRIKFFADRLLEVARIKAATEPYEGECDQEDLASYAGEVVKLRRAILAARAELARVKADAAAAVALVIINLESDLLDRVLEGSVWSMPEGTHTTDEWGRGVTDARRDIAAAVRATFADIADNDGLAMVSEPHDPGDGWTWNERLGWIGPDGKPAGRGK